MKNKSKAVNLSSKNKLYPVFLKLEKKLVVIIGGGFIAYQKLVNLTNTEARLVVIAPHIIPEIKELEGSFPHKRNIKFVEREYEWGDEKNASLVIAATNIPELNNSIANRCRDQNIMVNSVDEPEHCDFYVPSIVQQDSIKIAISTDGKAPALAQSIRKELEQNFINRYAKLLPIITNFREKVHQKFQGQENFGRRAKLIRWFTERQIKS